MTRLLVWRGPLDSCNYGCAYCPFAKRPARLVNLREDAAALRRFVDHVVADPTPVDVLVMPWGEAMIWPWYGDAVRALCAAPHVRSVGVQSNGSFPIERVDRWPAHAGLWLTWHPTEVPMAAFVQKVRALRALGTPLSVGAVATPDRLAALRGLRDALPTDVPLWLNRQKPGPRFSAAQAKAALEIDPDFRWELRPVPSRGRACATGDEVWMLDGDGTISRCHLIPTRLGSLYEGGASPPGPCTRASCHCFVGYAFLDEVGLWRRWRDRFVTRRRPEA